MTATPKNSAAVTVSVTFDAAHQNHDFGGKCGNLHGHTYTLTAKVYGPVHESGRLNGMCIDFGSVKGILRQVAEACDHAYLTAGDERLVLVFAEHEHVTAFASSAPFTVFDLPVIGKVCYLGERTTAENIAMAVMRLLEDEGWSAHVKVAETPTSSVEVFR